MPSSAESALFGTKICDLHVPVRPGGDVALRQRRAAGARRPGRGRRGVRRRPTPAAGTSWSPRSPTQDPDDLLEQAGVTAEQLEAFVDLYARSRVGRSSSGRWASPSTATRSTACGRSSTWPGPRQRRARRRRAHADPRPLGRAGRRRDGCLRHGAPRRRRRSTPTNAAALGAQWGFAVPVDAGPDRARDGRGGRARASSTCSGCSGGNFLEVLPDPDAVRAALGRVPLRVHQDIVLTSQMLVEGDDVLLLPVATRYEQEGGGTETTTERRIVFSPEIPRQVGEARSEWRLFAEVAARVRPDLAAAFAWTDNQGAAGGDRRGRPGLRRHRGARGHRRPGAVGWPPPVRRRRVPHARRPRSLHRARAPGRRTCRRARSRSPPGGASSSTRWCTPRSTRSPAPAGTRSTSTRPTPPPSVRRRAPASGCTSGTGTFDGRCKLVRLPARSLQVHWPEGNVLIAGGPASASRSRRSPTTTPSSPSRCWSHDDDHPSARAGGAAAAGRSRPSAAGGRRRRRPAAGRGVRAVWHRPRAVTGAAPGRVRVRPRPRVVGIDRGDRRRRPRRAGACRQGDRVAVEVFQSCRACDRCTAGRYRRCPRHGLRDMYGFVAVSTWPPGLWGGYAEHQYLAPDSMLLPVPPMRSTPSWPPCSTRSARGSAGRSRVPETKPGDVVAVLGPGVRGLSALPRRPRRRAPASCSSPASARGRRAPRAGTGVRRRPRGRRQHHRSRRRAASRDRRALADVVVDVTAKAPAALAQAVGLAPVGRHDRAGRHPRARQDTPGLLARPRRLQGAAHPRRARRRRADATAPRSTSWPPGGTRSPTCPAACVGLDDAEDLVRSMAGESATPPPVHGVVTP